MARKAGTNGKSSTPIATTLLMPAEAVIRGLAKAKTDSQKQMRSASAIFGEKFSKAQEEKHVDRRAANIAFGLNALDDKTLGTTYFHLLRYMDDLGITDRATKQSEMFEADSTSPGLKGDEEEDGDEGGNVTKIGTAARKVAETAGERAG